MLSKAKIKFIKSLQIKKYRKQEQCFLVQGAKSVQELLASDFDTIMIVGTATYLSGLSIKKGTQIIEASEKELNDLSAVETNEDVIAVAQMKPNALGDLKPPDFGLVLDDIRDPGNLGTIIRTADWFGIQLIIASPETADFYNPKVISATVGSFTRIPVYYTPLAQFLTQWKGKIYGTFLEGHDVHNETFRDGGLILIGNESRGISEELKPLVTNKITIPKYGGAESLNAAIATGIICDVIRNK